LLQDMQTSTELALRKTWRVISASVRGRRHEKTGQPCQDAHWWTAGPEGLLVTAVADGAGSASLAELGAELAASTAVRVLAERLAVVLNGTEELFRDHLQAAFQAAQEAVLSEAVLRQVHPRELAATLLVVLASPHLVVAGQIGDGAIIIQTPYGGLEALTRPAAGEYLNETQFLVSPAALNQVQVSCRKGPITHLALFSDGLQMLALKMPAGDPHAPFFAPLLRLAEAGDIAQARGQLEAFLKSPRVGDRTDDDLTLVVAAIGESR
jgi:hypothetical protein